MTCISCKEIYNRSSSITIKNERQYQRVWRVETDDPHTGPLEVELYWVAQTGIVAGLTYATATESDLGAYALDIRVNCVAMDGKSWTVTCNYGWDDQSGETNPLLKQPEFDWSFSQWTEPTHVDIYGNFIQASWYLTHPEDPKPYPPVERQHSLPVLRVTRNEATFSPLYAAQYKDSINSNVFLGAPRHCVKISNIQAKSVYDQKFRMTYWNVQYEFQFNLNTFDYIEVDVKWGTDMANGKPTKPVFLDGAGAELPQGDPLVFNTFEIYPELPFNFNFIP